jgi:hypothetical protein
LKIFSTLNGWEEVLGEAINHIDQSGIRESRHQACTFNYSEDDQRRVAVISWSKVHEDYYNDQSRGGCCLIF